RLGGHAAGREGALLAAGSGEALSSGAAHASATPAAATAGSRGRLTPGRGGLRQERTDGGPTMARFHHRSTTMPTQSNRGRAQDRSKVAAGQKHEVKYEAGKTGASTGEVREAVKDVGNSRNKVESVLGERKGPK